ncbi:MAG: AAA family ATPase [Bacteroidales bacterium]|nr:AAA family ATPase [Bacteroidales bacterium]
MINKIEIKNFKSIKKCEVKVSYLNLLMGLNGMGKSSFLHALLLFKQSNLESGRFFLNDKYVKIGKSNDAFYQFAEEDFIEFNLEFRDNEKREWRFNYIPGNDFLDSNIRLDNEFLNRESFLTGNFQYINAERVGPREIYSTSSSDTLIGKQLGNFGQFAVHFLNLYGNEKISEISLQHPKAKSSSLIHNVDAWLSEISPGVKLNTRDIPGTDQVLLDVQFELSFGLSNPFRPTNVGFGISYVLPVILALLKAEPQKVIIIENPESHIHPRGQAELGKLISLAANIGSQLFIETHSDHLLNGIRVSVKENLVDKSKVNVMYFEKTTT